MPVVINYKICDLAPECSGIEACPVKAFFWNEKMKRPDVDNNKCVSCGLCALECPVGAIILARSEEEYKTLVERLKSDPRTEAELWRERLGTQPGRTKPLAVKITPENFEKEVTKSKGVVAVTSGVRRPWIVDYTLCCGKIWGWLRRLLSRSWTAGGVLSWQKN